jgi:hypothetical protein
MKYIALTLKRTKEKHQIKRVKGWCNQTDQLLPERYVTEKSGYNKKNMDEDCKSLNGKLKRFTNARVSEYIVEKNKDNKYYHAHFLIHTEDIEDVVKTLLWHIGATQQKAEDRWLERHKMIKTYYRSIDAKWGETYWTTAFNLKGALDYIGKTEIHFGEKKIFILKE